MSQHVEQDEYLDAVAVIGLAGRFPGARDVKAYWNNLRDGVESVRFFTREELLAAGTDPAQLDHPAYVRARGYLDDPDLFDAAFFGFNPREAEIMDPQTRIFLETAWSALENAGYDSERYDRPVAVYAGGGASQYMLYNTMVNPAAAFALGGLQAMLLTSPGFISTWTSYKLNLKGPSLNVSTACSTGLVAIHLAAQALLNGECSMALAGSTSVTVPTMGGYLYEEGGISSDDGHTRSFDASATGTLVASGVGVVVLKRYEDALADGDTIHALIRGSAINNDGSLKIGFTAPSVDGQAEAIAEAHAIARVDPTTIGYVECHGSATPLGDPIEVTALAQAFKGSGAAPRSVGIGSVKSNFGHCDSAAGTAGFIKAVLSLENGQIPPSLNFRQPNPEMDVEAGPFYVNTELREWPRNGAPRRGGVSSFGIGGTNVHVVLEEPPVQPPTPPHPWQLVVLSARTATALEQATADLTQHLQENPGVNLADVAWTLQTGRRVFPFRRVFAARDVADALEVLTSRTGARLATFSGDVEDRPLVFAFSPEGAQEPGTGRELYETEEAFRREVDACAQILRQPLGLDIRDLLFAPESRADVAAEKLHTPAVGGPASFVLEYALAKLWISWGIEPQAVVGHGVGDYVAAVIAGQMALHDALNLVALRGSLISKLPHGVMLVLPHAEEVVRPLLEGEVMVLSVDGPAATLVSGSPPAIAALEQRLAAQGVPAADRIPAEFAFQPSLMEAMSRTFAEAAQRVTLRAPSIPVLSSLTGAWLSPAEATDPGYWVRHLRGPVRFVSAALELFRDPSRVVLEVGAGSAVTSMLGGHPDRPATLQVMPSLMKLMADSDRAAVLAALGGLWLTGRTVDWSRLHRVEERRRVPLPTYPFERQRFWIQPMFMQQPQTAAGEDAAGQEEAAAGRAQAEQAARSYHPRPNLQNAYVAPEGDAERAIVEIWQELFGIEPIGVHDNFFELGGQSLLGTQVVSRVRSVLQVDIPVRVLFEGPTVAELAAAIAAGAGQDSTQLEAIQRIDRGGDAEDLLARIDDLSEEEMERLLAEMSAGEEIG